MEEVNKVQVLIRRLVFETESVILDKDKTYEWFKSFRDTLRFQELCTNPNPYALELLNEARDFNQRVVDAKRKSAESRWKKESDKSSEQPTQKAEPPAKIQSPKSSHGEFGNVMLTAEEEAKLKARLGVNFQKAVEILSNYKASSGKNYKSDYAAINNWVEKRLKEDQKNDSPRNLAEYYDGLIDKYFPQNIGVDSDGNIIGFDS